MVHLLKVLSDIVPKPSTTFSCPNMSKTQSQTQPHQNLLSGGTEFQKPKLLGHTDMDRSHRDGPANSLSPIAIILVSPRYAVGPTEFA